MKLLESQNELAIMELTPREVDLVSGGGEDGGAPPPRPPACECHSDRNGNLVCQDANGRKC